ncbi:MAG: sigma-70 family RNA polymerase sigma factor [Bryobacterales bacterium]|nr:sigma-70 family RNA polymerase sigma factor [Bryobacterales bacterium]
MDYSDEDLIEQARAATSMEERNALTEQLFERHYRRVALWCLRWCGSREQAEDLAQEIFLKVHRNLASFQRQSKFTTWLFMVCRNHCINSGMAARSSEAVELDQDLMSTLAAAGPDPEQSLAQAKRRELALELIHRNLDPTEREVFVLHHVEGWSLPMVSRALQLNNASGAKAYLVSAQRKLKTAVARWRARTGA